MEQLAINFERRDEVERLPVGLRRLAELIRNHDVSRPAGAQEMAFLCKTNVRGIAASVRELVMRHRLPIGSTRGSPAGYYWIRSREELDGACAMYHETAMELLRREAALKRITVDELLGQLKLEHE